MRGAAALLFLLVGVLLAPGAAAQVQVQLSVRSRRVEANEPFSVSLSAMSNRDEPQLSAPRLGLPQGFVQRGPDLGTQRSFTISGGRASVRVGVTANWTVTAPKEGRYVIGPATVTIDGRRVTSNTVTIEVVPAGLQRRFGFPWFMPPLLQPPPTAPSLEEQYVPPPPEFRTDHPLADQFFLRVVAEPARVVLGEQVTLTAIAYWQGRLLNLDLDSPDLAAFVSRPLLETPEDESEYLVRIGTDFWHAQKVREVALFPLEIGRQQIEPSVAGFVARGPRGVQRFERRSAPLEVVVTEPPADGRPTGYRLGDVGQFSLKAEIRPRSVAAGETISVVVEVAGTGNFPTRLRPPQQNGVEWLEPTVTDKVRPVDDRLQGFKRFSYLVRLSDPGRIDLGEFALPYWDPARHRYATARAQLGTVTATAPQEQTVQLEAEDRLASVGEPRGVLGPSASRPLRWAHHLWYWVLLGAAPLSVLAVAGATRLVSVAWRRLRERQASAYSRAQRALAEAERAARQNDTPATASAGERALYLAIEAATGVKARGLLRDELEGRLGAAGLSGTLVKQVDDLLTSFDEIRFTGASEQAARDLVARTRACLLALSSRWSRTARRTNLVPGAALAALLILAGGTARADDPPPRYLAGVSALQKGDFDGAIDDLEALADTGFVHPDASYDRGVAYVQRARSPQAEPGDLGRAAAAFAETLELRPSDRAARRALDVIREEVAQRRIRAGAEPAVVTPTLGRAVVGLLDEGVWTLVALLGSFLLAIGLAIRWLARQPTIRLAASVAGSVGVLALVVGGVLTIAAVTYRAAQPAVVVVPEAQLLTESGTPREAGTGPDAERAIPEGSEVFVLERQGSLARVQWGTSRVWVRSATLRALATR